MSGTSRPAAQRKIPERHDVQQHCCVSLISGIMQWFIKLTKINSMEQSPSWKSNSYSVSQEIPNVLWKQNVHYPAHNSPSIVPVLEQINPIHGFFPFLEFHFNIILLSTLRSSKLQSFPSNSSMYFSSPWCVPHAQTISLFLTWSPE